MKNKRPNKIIEALTLQSEKRTRVTLHNIKPTSAAPQTIYHYRLEYTADSQRKKLDTANKQ